MNNSIKYFLLILVIGIAAFGYYSYTKPLASITDMAIDVSLSAEELLLAFEADESQANIDYLDKVVSISGRVSRVESKDGISTIYLNTENELSYIICQLEDPKAMLPAEGSSITIKGICTGYLMDVVIVRSIIA